MTLLLIFAVIGFALFLTKGDTPPKYPDSKTGMYDKKREVRLSEEHESLTKEELDKSLGMLAWLNGQKQDEE